MRTASQRQTHADALVSAEPLLCRLCLRSVKRRIRLGSAALSGIRRRGRHGRLGRPREQLDQSKQHEQHDD